MSSNHLKTFIHPHKVYRLEHPEDGWEEVIEKNGESCGFGPLNRDDVGLWISIMAVSIDLDKITAELPNLMQQAMDHSGGVRLRQDTSLRHYGLIADCTREGQAGHYWIVADNDIILFASSQVPISEADIWNPHYHRLMASLRITHESRAPFRKLAEEVVEQLRGRHPDQEFKFDGEKILGKNQTVFLSNLYRDVSSSSSPARRKETINRFVETLATSSMEDLGHEEWDDVRDCILPVLKHRTYVKADGPTKDLLTSEWLADVVICYAIHSKKIFRFVTPWDVRRWETDVKTLHDLAIENVSKLPWPSQVQGARVRRTGHIIILDTRDSLESSRLLHKDLHKLFSSVLGSPFLAGIPYRNTLVLFSDGRKLKKRISRQLMKDYKASAYPITPHPFLVTADGIAPAHEEGALEEDD